jgi:glutamate 5-kinase
MSEIRDSSNQPIYSTEGFEFGSNSPYKRIVAKAGTNVLTGGTEHLDKSVITQLVSQVVELHQHGVQVIVVTSGAVASGRQLLEQVHTGKRDEPSRQVQAAVGQSRLMHAYEVGFDLYGVATAQALVSRGDLDDRMGYLNVRNTLLELLDLRVVPIVNENDVVAVEELMGETFGDNDALSAMIANLVDADLLVLLTDTEGLHTSDPDQDPTATLIKRVERVDAKIEALAGNYSYSRGRGGMPTKLQAAKLANSFGVAVVIADGRKSDTLLQASRGQDVGTLFVPTSPKVESRKRWMLSGLSTRGGISIDMGAADALRRESSSLLPAGIQKVDGEFQRGDIVAISDVVGARVSCGITNYSSWEIDIIKGAQSDHIEERLGYQYGQEVVHRNNMVLTE